MNLVVRTGHGAHPSILIILFDNDPTRDMLPRHIVTAIAHLESTGAPFRESGLHSQSLALIDRTLWSESHGRVWLS